MENVMRNIQVEKVTLNCGCGTDHTRLEKSIKLLAIITGKTPIKTITQKRIPNWGLRKGLPVGGKVTLRGKDAQAIIPRLLTAKENKLGPNCFDTNGNVSFGIPECIDIPGVEYDPAIGIIGLQVSITLKRPGFRIKNRVVQRRKIPDKHTISQADAIEFAKSSWAITVDEEDA
jgi:large subunit ribosomal protein L5